MRAPDILLTVLFPLLIAVGIALGMDATVPTEFWYPRAAFVAAALIAWFLTLRWLYLAEFTWTVGLLTFLSTGTVGVALLAGLKWLDAKENIYCIIEPNIEMGGFPVFGPGPYTLVAVNSGPYPVIHVHLTIRSAQISGWPIEGLKFDIGDIEPNLATKLDQLPPLPPGTYQIDIRARSGAFFEILTIKYDGKRATAEREVYRQTVEGSKVISEVVPVI